MVIFCTQTSARDNINVEEACRQLVMSVARYLPQERVVWSTGDVSLCSWAFVQELRRLSLVMNNELVLARSDVHCAIAICLLGCIPQWMCWCLSCLTLAPPDFALSTTSADISAAIDVPFTERLGKGGGGVRRGRGRWRRTCFRYRCVLSLRVEHLEQRKGMF